MLQFLRPYRQYLGRKGFSFSSISSDNIDYERLIQIFLSPERDTPSDLIDGLFFVDEMSTPVAMDELQKITNRRTWRLNETAEVTPADVAMNVWLNDKDLLIRLHIEQSMLNVRQFQSFQTITKPDPKFRRPSQARLDALEADLDSWFQTRNRGPGTRVFLSKSDDAGWFVVRHGDLIKREESLDGKKASSVCFRPAKYDVLVYDPEAGELRIHAGTKGERELYRTRIGKHLFGDEAFFPGTEKFTLEPLRVHEEASMNCVDILGLDSIRLIEVHFHDRSDPWETEVIKSDDVFLALTARDRPFPQIGEIVQAKFEVAFTGSTTRMVTIRPSNVAIYGRDEDSAVVETWLKARGFIIPEERRNRGRPSARVEGD